VFESVWDEVAMIPEEAVVRLFFSPERRGNNTRRCLYALRRATFA
jgi:hypothetical protein